MVQILYPKVKMHALIRCKCKHEYVSLVKFHNNDTEITVSTPCPKCGLEANRQRIVEEVARGDKVRAEEGPEEDGFEEEHRKPSDR